MFPFESSENVDSESLNASEFDFKSIELDLVEYLCFDLGMFFEIGEDIKSELLFKFKLTE